MHWLWPPFKHTSLQHLQCSESDTSCFQTQRSMRAVLEGMSSKTNQLTPGFHKVESLARSCSSAISLPYQCSPLHCQVPGLPIRWQLPHLSIFYWEISITQDHHTLQEDLWQLVAWMDTCGMQQMLHPQSSILFLLLLSAEQYHPITGNPPMPTWGSGSLKISNRVHTTLASPKRTAPSVSFTITYADAHLPAETLPTWPSSDPFWSMVLPCGTPSWKRTLTW